MSIVPSPVAFQPKPAGPALDVAGLTKRLTELVKRMIQAITADDLRQSEISDMFAITPRDDFPPAVPAGLSGVAGVNSIELAWQRNTEDDFQGYNVYRSTEGAAFEKVAALIDAPAHSDRQVEAGKRYRYTVSSVDQAGNESGRPEPVEVTAQ
jgi:fibronectin type 3 domain-containing protein